MHSRAVLVTGGAGYLGSVLSGVLLGSGYTVRALDDLSTGRLQAVEPLFSYPGYRLLRGDLTRSEDVAKAVEGVGAVVHLAGLVGDQACRLAPERTRKVNVEATRRLAEAALERGVGAFLFASSCSVYGFQNSQEYVGEDAVPRPLSLYAESKAAAESLLLDLAVADPAFTPVILRLATLYGLSPRMRFDLVVNAMTAAAYATGRVTVRGGRQWRPLLHVQDAARLFQALLETPEVFRTGGQTFNLGFTQENYRILELAELVCREVPGTKIEVVCDGEDQRSYRVSFDRLARFLRLPGHRSASEGIREIAEAFARGEFADYPSADYRNA